MKKYSKINNLMMVVFLTGIVLFSGCASFKPALYEKSLTGLDFTKYGRDSFFITTGDYFQKYKSVSILRVTCYNGYLKKESPESQKTDIWKYDDPLYSEKPSSFKKKDYDYKSCKLSELLDYMVESARKINANGLIRLEITPIKQISPVNEKVQNGILISGLAISF
jgi:hypothetical protein